MAELTLETAKKMYLEGGAGKDFALDNFEEEELTKKELPKTWERLILVEGAYCASDCEIAVGRYHTVSSSRNMFATKEQAEASIAMAQLTQLMKAYNGDWVADWMDSSPKYTIYMHKNKPVIREWGYSKKFLAFKSNDLAEQFLENFKDLIETAKPLL